ncbi:MAG: SPFH domain-containing protein [bacterium]
MKTQNRLTWTAICIALYFALSKTYGAFASSVEASAAVAQVKDSIVAYTFGQKMAHGNIVPTIMFWLFAFVMFLLWRKPVWDKIKGAGGSGTSTAALVFALAVAFTNTACMGPAKVLPLEKVGPNETAFVIPLEGQTSNQAKFESVEFLNAHKVMSKQIEIPVRERSTGRWSGDYEWIPTVRVIKVDRSLVTREWTKGGASGTSKKDEALSVASLDGINFHLGVNMTASILEEDAPTYLYWHGQKTLAEVVDTNIRGYLQGIMADEFGKLNLEKCKSEKANIFKKANDEAIAKFKGVGITISYVGSSQGFLYDDAAIQNKINETQTAEMSIQVADKKNQEQTKLNLAIVSKAIADRQAAEEYAKAASAQSAKIALDIDKIRAEAMLEAAKNLPNMKGQLPSVMPAGSTLLFGFDKPFSSPQK